MTSISVVEGVSNPDTDLSEIAVRGMREAAEYNEATGQRGNSWVLPAKPGTEAQIPVWSGRPEWQRELRESLHSKAGAEICRTHKVSIEKVYAVGVMHARYADDRTGRRVAASVAKIADKAGVSPRVVVRARAVMKELGLAAEIVRGRYLTVKERLAAALLHGKPQLRAASTWALTSPKAPIPGTQGFRHPQNSHSGVLPRGSSFSSVSPVRENSPTRARARGSKISSKGRAPRSVALQRAAAELVAKAPILDSGHIGAICDVLEALRVDTSRWTGRDLVLLLDQDSRQLGWVWPSHVDSPAGFLRSRLSRLDLSGEPPSERAAREAAERAEVSAARLAEAEQARSRAASSTARARAMALFKRSTRMNRGK